MLHTAVEIAKMNGVTNSTVYNWIKQGCPVAKRGAVGKGGHMLDSREVIEWRLQQERDKQTDFGENMSKEEAQRRKLQAQAELAEIEVAKEKGQVVELEELESELADKFAHLRSRLRRIPERCVMRVIGETDERAIKDILLEEIDDVLEVLSNEQE